MSCVSFTYWTLFEVIKSYFEIKQDQNVVNKSSHRNTRSLFPFQLDMFSYFSPIHLDYKTSKLNCNK